MAESERRLTRLETQLAPDEARLVWAEVDGTLPRQQARARLAVCHRLAIDVGDPRVVEAIARLRGDDPERVAQETALIATGPRARGLAADTGDIRRRTTPRLDILVRRLHGP